MIQPEVVADDFAADPGLRPQVLGDFVTEHVQALFHALVALGSGELLCQGQAVERVHYPYLLQGGDIRLIIEMQDDPVIHPTMRMCQRHQWQACESEKPGGDTSGQARGHGHDLQKWQ